jgi:glycine dehydrogenase
MISIRGEIAKIESGEWSREDNPLKHAPHTASVVTGDAWERSYPRSLGAYPAKWTRDFKFWPPVSRVDNVYGDRNIVCTCPPIEEYEQ